MAQASVRLRSTSAQSLLGVLVALALGACSSTQDQSARLERLARAHAHAALAGGLNIAQRSRRVKVLESVLLSGSESDAVAVRIRNESDSVLQRVPIAVTVRLPSGRVLYRNNQPGLATSLVSLALLAPRQEMVWVDDQVQLEGMAAGAHAPSNALTSAEVGEVTPIDLAASMIPRLRLSGVHSEQTAELGEATSGTLENRSSIAQTSLIVYGSAQHGGRIVAAGRAEIPTLAAGASSTFQIFMIGDSRGASVALSAMPNTLG